MVFLGFRLKRQTLHTGAANSPAVRSICSMSYCIRGQPVGSELVSDGFNDAGCYNTIPQALATIASCPSI